MEKILLVIDLQEEFKDKFYYDKIIKFINSNKQNYNNIIATQFVNTNKFYKKYLHWNGCKSIQKLNDFKPDSIILKSSYGLPSQLVNDFYNKRKNITIDIIGCEIDACILATAFQLWDFQIPFKILSDYIYSNNKKLFRDDLMSLLKRQFGDLIK